jgi:enoyl-CoA hydratase/carnithine racemase
MIEVEAYDEVAVLRLAHGPVNALDLELCVAIRDTLAGYTDAGAVVLTGTGSCLSAGVDLKRLVDGGPAYVEDYLPALSDAFLAVFDHPRPIVAAVNGHAIAGGCVIVAAADVRLMSGGGIGLTELAVGVPFPLVAMEIVRHVTGPYTDEMVLGGAVLGPAEAAAKGLVEVTAPEELLDRAVSRARDLARVPQATYRLTKEQLHRAAKQRIDTSRTRDDERVLDIWRSGASLDGIRSYLENLPRKPALG